VGTFGPFTIRGTCTSTGDVDPLTVGWSVSDAEVQSQGNGNVGPVFQENHGGPTNVRLDEGPTNNNDEGMSTFSASRSGGFDLSGLIAYSDALSFNNQSVCVVQGEVIFG
jgi:hypothetical protein